jgi:putative glutamine amidotransferase
MQRRNQAAHEAQLTPGSMLAKITGRQTLGVNSTHHQAVRKVAGPLTASAAAPDGVVEALEWKGGAAPCPFLLSVQFHPERLAEGQAAHRAMFEAFIQACA